MSSMCITSIFEKREDYARKYAGQLEVGLIEMQRNLKDQAARSFLFQLLQVLIKAPK